MVLQAALSAVLLSALLCADHLGRSRLLLRQGAGCAGMEMCGQRGSERQCAVHMSCFYRRHSNGGGHVSSSSSSSFRMHNKKPVSTTNVIVRVARSDVILVVNKRDRARGSPTALKFKARCAWVSGMINVKVPTGVKREDGMKRVHIIFHIFAITSESDTLTERHNYRWCNLALGRCMFAGGAHSPRPHWHRTAAMGADLQA